MRRKKILVFIAFILTFVSVSFGYVVKADNVKVYVGGMAVGFILSTDGAEVVGLCDVFTENGSSSPSRDCGIENGDSIIKLNGYTVKGAEDIAKALIGFKGGETEVVIRRKKDTLNLKIVPLKDASTKMYKIGLFIRDCLSGIGTVTYIKQDDLRFGSLGHPILNNDNQLINVEKGDIYTCSVIGVNKAYKGKAGDLKGIFIRDKVVATANKNSSSGVFGKFNSVDTNMRLVSIGNAKVGKAEIVTTVEGTEPKSYEINIIKVDKNEKNNKNLVIKITDKNLLSITGGIVQGMSGSPILQNGEIVGAVTHVFLNDSTRGFGILIDKMVNE